MNQPNTAQMGFSEAFITPTKPVELAGFFRPDNQSQGILHPLKLQVMIWKHKEDITCLITIDSLGFTVELSNLLRDRATALLPAPRDHVMLCFSHTHSAPNAANEPEYFESVCRQAEECVKQAKANLFPAFAAWSTGENEIGLNRRNDPDSTDRRLGILKVSEAGSQSLKLLLLRVTAHANILSSDNYRISSDYFGVTRELLEKKYNCKVMMVQGASGDIRPKYHQDNTEYLEVHCYEAAEKANKKYSDEYRKKYTAQSQEALYKTAGSISDSVSAVINSIDVKPVTYIKAKSVFQRFTADVPSLKRAEIIAEEAEREAGIDGRGWLDEVKRLHNNGIRHQWSDIEIQYFVINNGCFCGIANEAMCRIALDVQETAQVPLLFFNGYTNGCNSYLPTAEEYDKGGYEVLWSNLVYYCYHGRVMPFNRDTADKLVREAVKNYLKIASSPESVIIS